MSDAAGESGFSVPPANAQHPDIDAIGQGPFDKLFLERGKLQRLTRQWTLRDGQAFQETDCFGGRLHVTLQSKGDAMRKILIAAAMLFWPQTTFAEEPIPEEIPNRDWCINVVYVLMTRAQYMKEYREYLQQLAEQTALHDPEAGQSLFSRLGEFETMRQKTTAEAMAACQSFPETLDSAKE